MAVKQELLDKIKEYEKEYSTDEIIEGLLQSKKYPDVVRKIKIYQQEGHSNKEILEGIKTSSVIKPTLEVPIGEPVKGFQPKLFFPEAPPITRPPAPEEFKTITAPAGVKRLIAPEPTLEEIVEGLKVPSQIAELGQEITEEAIQPIAERLLGRKGGAITAGITGLVPRLGLDPLMYLPLPAIKAEWLARYIPTFYRTAKTPLSELIKGRIRPAPLKTTPFQPLSRETIDRLLEREIKAKRLTLPLEEPSVIGLPRAEQLRAEIPALLEQELRPKERPIVSKIPPELEPLAEEARKYKNAKEFAKSLRLEEFRKLGFKEFKSEELTTLGKGSIITTKLTPAKYKVVEAMPERLSIKRIGSNNIISISPKEIDKVIKAVGKPEAPIEIQKTFLDKELTKFGYKSLTDFYNQVIKEGKPIPIKPLTEEIKPLAKEPWQMTKEEITNKPLTWIMQPTGTIKTIKGVYDGQKYIIQQRYGIPEKFISHRLKEGRTEFYLPSANHKKLIQQALAEGKSVPPEVLANYPDLAKKVEVSKAKEIKPPKVEVPSTLAKTVPKKTSDEKLEFKMPVSSQEAPIREEITRIKQNTDLEKKEAWENLPQDLKLTSFEKTRRAIEDLNFSLKKLNRKIKETAKEDIEDTYNLYAKKDMLSRRLNEQLRRIEEEKINFVKKAVNSNIPLEQIDELLIARHAKEFNLEMKRRRLAIGKKARGNLSGMTDEEAEAIINKYKDNIPLNELVTETQNIAKENLELAHNPHKIDPDLFSPENRLISLKEYKTYKLLWSNYVPFYRDIEEAVQGSYIGKKGISILGREFKRAKGSELEIISPISNVFWQREKIITDALANEIGITIKNFVKKYPQLKTIFRIEKYPVVPIGKKELTATIDKEFINNLIDFAKSLGLEEFTTKGKVGRRLGWYSPKLKKILRTFASDDEVVAHEVGHFFDDIYELRKFFYVRTKETREVGEEIFKFSRDVIGETRSRAANLKERFANAFSWWLSHRDLAERDIPLFSKIMENIIKDIPDLKPLLSIRPTPKLEIERMTEFIFTPKVFLRPNEVGFKVNGTQCIIKTTPDIARALKNIDLVRIPYALKFFRNALTMFQAMVTKYRPEFFLTNLERDMGQALINLGVERGWLAEKGKGLRLETIKGLKSSWKELWDYLHIGKSTSEVDRFFKLGGNVGHFYAEDYMTSAKSLYDLEKQFKNEGIEKIFNPIRVADKFIDDVNKVGELGIRYSAFKALVRRGMSEDKAIQAVADLTVNFARHGEITPLLKTFYAFVNPSIQGLAKTGRVMVSPAGRKQIISSISGLVGLGYAMGVISKMFDRDGDNAMGRWRKNNTLSLAIGDNRIITLFNLPYGLTIFYSLGRNLADLTYGDKNPMEVMHNITETTFNSFAPIEMDFFSIPPIPSLSQPIVGIQANKAWWGGKIYPEKFPQEKRKDYEIYWDNTTKQAIFLARLIYNLSLEKIDIHPNSLEYLYTQYFGGYPEFVSSIIEASMKLANGEFDTSKIPFLRKFYTIARQKEKRLTPELLEEYLRR